MAHFPHGEDRLQWAVVAAAGRQARKGLARQATDALANDILAGQEKQHAGRREGRRGIYTKNAAMRMGRAQHVRKRRSRGKQVVDEAPATGQEPLVLDARERRADHWKPY